MLASEQRNGSLKYLTTTTLSLFGGSILLEVSGSPNNLFFIPSLAEKELGRAFSSSMV